MWKWLQNLLGVRKGMKIQFRVLKCMGGDQYLVHLAYPAIKGHNNPEGDPWAHLGVIVMTKAMIEDSKEKGLDIIWTQD